MIAMQYSFTLPADYDMEIIDRRIREKGALPNGFPHLRFKAYLSARRHDTTPTSSDNLYAPFYLWNEPEGLNDFLAGPGFTAVARDFGRPVVRTWMVWHAATSGADLRSARYATRTIVPIMPHDDIAELRTDTVSNAEKAMQAGAISTVAAFDPQSWTMLRFSLLLTPPDQGRLSEQHYKVGYVALP